MIAVQPRYARLIEKGFKTLEVRKSIPKGFVGWVWLYETEGKRRWVTDELWGDKYPLWIGYEIYSNAYLPKRLITEGRGKIIARWWHDDKEAETIMYAHGFIDIEDKMYYVRNGQLKEMFLTYEELENYGKGKDLYAWKITKLEVFEEPMFLEDFYRGTFYDTPFKLSQLKDGEFISKPKWLEMATIKRPPQSWQYVYAKEKNNDKKIPNISMPIFETVEEARQSLIIEKGNHEYSIKESNVSIDLFYVRWVADNELYSYQYKKKVTGYKRND